MKVKEMFLYEHVFLARQDITTQYIDQLIEQYRNIIQKDGGKIDYVENWGFRLLAYRIKKYRKAYYILMHINSSSDSISEMERQMRINEHILRFLTIRVESYGDVPSIFLEKHDREDRFKKDNNHLRNVS